LKTINQYNFHKHTFCIWQEVTNKDFQALYKNYKSKSGSEYYFTDEGVYRISNHWGRVGNCRWKIASVIDHKSQVKRIAYAKWDNFYLNNEYDKLFFISYNTKNNSIDYHHKDSLNFTEKYQFKTATETAKTIKTIKEIIANDNWAKHLTYDDIFELRNHIITELISTDKTFLEIKKMYI
jgi:hypothetical protein